MKEFVQDAPDHVRIFDAMVVRSFLDFAKKLFREVVIDFHGWVSLVTKGWSSSLVVHGFLYLRI